MPSPQEDQINRLCSKADIRAKAISLYNTLRATTGRGTGYDLGQATPGLPSICAYLASQRLISDDVSEEVARNASCLSKRVWLSALKTTKAALDAHEAHAQRLTIAQPTVEQTRYRELVEKFKIGRPQRVASWMLEAERTLTVAAEYRRRFSDLDVNGWDVKISVFFWVSRVLNLKQVKEEPESIIKEYGADPHIFASLLKLADRACAELRERINNTVADLRAQAGVVSSASPISRQPSVQRSPTKSALRVTQSATPSQGTKRKVAFSRSSVSNGAESADGEEEIYVPESPSKRQKISSSPYKTPKTLTPQEVYTYPMPLPPPELVASSSKVTLEDVNMGARALLAEPSQPIAGPSTPRRTAQARVRTHSGTPTHTYRVRTPQLRPEAHHFPSFDNEFDNEEEEYDDDLNVPVRTRFRPVLLPYAQWEKRAPLVEREAAAAQKKMDALMKRWGHPFEWIRSGAGQ